MIQDLQLYNTLSRKKEVFEPLNAPHVGMYVCGPTVYSDVHLGNCRTFISFDLIFRYLKYSGYKVRYVRNITDAGHLEGDRDEGDDKFAKRAKLEQLEPMEIVQKYTLGFHDVLRMFNTLPPSIEPTATGHIIEQIEMIKVIMANGYAYEVDGTIYFDVEKYSKKYNYTILTNPDHVRSSIVFVFFGFFAQCDHHIQHFVKLAVAGVFVFQAKNFSYKIVHQLSQRLQFRLRNFGAAIVNCVDDPNGFEQLGNHYWTVKIVVHGIDTIDADRFYSHIARCAGS